jgi:RimJ/RimL family protein N-acetyltransferase
MMEPYPDLQTARLVLREFALEDAPHVQRLVGEWEVAHTLLIVPHPYEDRMAQEWIATHRPAYEAGERVTWAVTLREEGALVGSITLHLHPPHDNAEVVRYGFEDLDLHRIHASHFGSNPASGKVMRKVGMSPEGVRPEHYKKWETYEDRVDYGLLARDWRNLKRR